MPITGSAPPATWPAADCSDFGEPFDAFPVETPFRVRPDLVKLTPGDDWLRIDHEWAAMLAAKLAALTGDERHGPAGNIMLAAPCDVRTERSRRDAIMRVARKLAATSAGGRLGLESTGGGVILGAAGYRAEVTQDVVRVQSDREDAGRAVGALACGSGASRLLGALAMSLQEDLVLMEQGSDGVPRAVVFHVSFPSAWDPAAKLGQDLLALHSPVADNALLQAAAARLGSALIGKGPFVRWVWTVTTDSRWRAWPPPAAAEATEATGANEPTEATEHSGVKGDGSPPLYFRLERQTTMPLGDGYGLFLIRVQVRPLADVLAQEGRLPSLQASLQSMSEGMVRYKNLAGARQRVLAM